MKLARRKGANLLTLAVMLVTGLVAYNLLDVLITDTITPTTVTNETVGTGNGTGYLSGTLDNFPVIAASDSMTCNYTAVGAVNYTLTDATGALVVTDVVKCAGATVRANYQYEDTAYYDSSLSRTIVTYIVPIGLLGLFAIAAFGIPV